MRQAAGPWNLGRSVAGPGRHIPGRLPDRVSASTSQWCSYTETKHRSLVQQHAERHIALFELSRTSFTPLYPVSSWPLGIVKT